MIDLPWEGRAGPRARRPGSSERQRALTPWGVSLALSAIWVLVGCGDGATEVAHTTIAADRFVSVYVDLRVSALRQPDGKIKTEDRDSILAHHGVTDADLLFFADMHGDDAIFMRGVWDSVEVVYQRVRTAENEAEQARLRAESGEDSEPPADPEN